MMNYKNNYHFRCTSCGTKNRIPAEKLNGSAKCGKCGSYIETTGLFSGLPTMVTDANFENQVLKSPLPVLLYCWATWCSTCSSTNPIIDEFARDSKGRVRVGRLNVEANQMLATKFNVTSIPFIFIFDNGQLKESFPGALTKHEIMMKMTRYF